jgi:predicted GNAT family N-acyltransferase
MSVRIRQATVADTSKWLALVRATLGEDHPSRHVYEQRWIASQLDPSAGHETWVADDDDRLLATLSVLNPPAATATPVANLGRNLFLADAHTNGAADELLGHVLERCSEKDQMTVARLPASDNAQQALFERHGCVCVGFQPLKHLLKGREEVLFYVKPSLSRLRSRVHISESLPQISELAAASLANLKIPGTVGVRDGATGYPLVTEVTFHDGSGVEYAGARKRAAASHPPAEISGGFNWGFGFMRVDTREALRETAYRASRATGFSRVDARHEPLTAIFARRGAEAVGGLEYYFDEVDRCLRVVDGFGTDDLTMGALLNRATQMAQEKFSAAYVEVDILTTAPRLLKSAEQLGFVPVAYLPAFFARETEHTDVVKMVKLNLVCTVEQASLTTHARAIVRIIENCLQDHKMGVALINLLRGLSFFNGLGDGELRKVARLFTQKLARPGERVFAKGDSGDEAFVVMRGSVRIHLDEKAPPVATVGQGGLFGEQAFLDSVPRAATAISDQPSILLVIKRTAFHELTQREPNLGMLVMRNFALELSRKLRKSTEAIGSGT